MPKKRTASGCQIARVSRCVVCDRLMPPQSRGRLYCSKRCKEIANFADALEARVLGLVRDPGVYWRAARNLRARLLTIANRVPPPNLDHRGADGRFR